MDCNDSDSSVKPPLLTTKSGVIEVRSRRQRKAPTRWADDPLAVVELGGSVDKLRTASAETVVSPAEVKVDEAMDDVEFGSKLSQANRAAVARETAVSLEDSQDEAAEGPVTMTLDEYEATAQMERDG
jgi:hypothetical protein